MHPLQEKFQVIVPVKEEGEDPWVSQASQRDLRGMEAWSNATSTQEDYRKFNLPPPGMEIENQFRSQRDNMPLSMEGETDVSKDANAQSLARGFKKQEMRPSDDCYTGEHVDHFYGDAGGFVERNNYLDRI
jgi:FtsP/CotA-like multicopper oxidase with cupredoxin domain